MTQEWVNEKRKENEKHLNDLRNKMIAIFRDAGFSEEQIEIQMRRIDGELGFTKYMERDTIYGDWSCTTFDKNTREELGEFCADSGMVGVFMLDEVLKYNPGVLDTLPEYCRTIIRDFDGDVQFKVSEKRWTVDEDTSYAKKGQVMLDYAVTVEGDGVDMRTGAPIVFVGTQTGL